MTSPTPLLAVTDLSKRYGPTPVLDRLSFSAEAGTLTVVAGANGAGKSTLLRCLGGLARFEGAARVGTQPLDGSTAARRLLAYVPQRVSLPGTSTVGEVLELFARLRGTTPGGLPFPEGFVPDAGRRVGVLSGGQQQRVVLAAALLGTPRLLLLDEPAANLDGGGRAALWEGLRAAAGTGAAVLVASPSPRDLAGVADRLLVLDGGGLAGEETWDRLREVRPVPQAAPGAAREVAR